MILKQTRIYLCAAVVLSWTLIGSPAFAQETEASLAVDTSYFKTGDDTWNLVESVLKNDQENVAMLLSRGADPNSKSSVGNSALMYAVEKGNMEIMKLLVEQGADVNTVGYNKETALFISVFANDFQAAKFLLEQGADPNVLDGYGVTPLIYAAATNQYQSADLLLFYEADETLKDADGNEALLAAVTFEHLETSDVLLQNGLDPDVRDKEGNTPTIVATQHGNYDILKLLLDYDADVNIPNNKNYTALAYALTYEDVKASELLIEKGANVNHEIDRGRNMIELARISENDTLLRMLKKEGATELKRADFSEFRLSWANSFNSTDYLLGFRGGLADKRHGIYITTGIDYRPFLSRIQLTSNDTIFQYRERRIGWSHTVGKEFRLIESTNGINLAFYASATGYLSFPRYAGSSMEPNLAYTVIPSTGLAMYWKYIGFRMGFDWYDFKNELDKGLKTNITVFFKIYSPETQYDRKEIYWE